MTRKIKFKCPFCGKPLHHEKQKIYTCENISCPIIKLEIEYSVLRGYYAKNIKFDSILFNKIREGWPEKWMEMLRKRNSVQ